MSAEKMNPRLGVNISAAGALAVKGTVVLSNANSVSFGMDAASVITASVFGIAAIQSLSAGTTQITSGQAIFSNSNGISFGASGQSVTMSLPRVSFWRNNRWAAQGNAQPGGPNLPLDVFLQVVSFPLGLNASRGEVLVSGNINNTITSDNRHSVTLALGVYTMSGSTASLATQWTSTGSQENLGAFIAASWKSLTGTISITPGAYMFALAASAVSFGLSFGGDGDIFGVNAVGGDDNGSYFGDGYFRSSFNGTLPASIHLTDVVKTYFSTNSAGNVARGGQPYLQLVGS